MSESHDPGLKDPELDGEETAGPRQHHPPESTPSATALGAEVLGDPDLHPALQAALKPIQWYLGRLKQDIDRLKAPVAWMDAVREKMAAQAQKDQAWTETVQEAGLRPFESGAEGVTVWVTTKPWHPDATWVVSADAPWDGEHGGTVWANPTLRALATEHTGAGSTFVERYPTQAAFLHQWDALHAPTREEER